MKMSKREWKRVDALERIAAGRFTGREAAEVLGLSPWQVRRLRRAVERGGAAGVLHGNRGREPSNRMSEELRARRACSLWGTRWLSQIRFDCGRSIENVEEFQLALLRQLTCKK
jgi:Winged helix-turn helix